MQLRKRSIEVEDLFDDNEESRWDMEKRRDAGDTWRIRSPAWF